MKHPDVQARGVARGWLGGSSPLEVLRKIRNETNSARNKEKNLARPAGDLVTPLNTPAKILEEISLPLR